MNRIATSPRIPLIALVLLSFTSAGCAEDESGASFDSMVEGSILDGSGNTVDLVSGAAFFDEDAGQLSIMLGSFEFGCPEVVDGLGFNTPPGGYYVESYPDTDDRARLYKAEAVMTEVGDAVQYNLVGMFSFTANVTQVDGGVEGDIDFGEDGSAEFVVEDCGSADPFGF